MAVARAGLEWKLRGYPWKVVVNNHQWFDSFTNADWCDSTLESGTWIRSEWNTVVFSQHEAAVMYDLAWAYEGISRDA